MTASVATVRMSHSRGRMNFWTSAFRENGPSAFRTAPLSVSLL